MPQNAANNPPALRALIVDDEPDICRTLALCLTSAGHEAVTASNSAEALALASRQSFDLVFLDLRLGTENGLGLISPLRETSPWLSVIVITAFAAVDTAVDAMKRGAADYLAKPFTPAHVRVLTKKIAEAQSNARRAAALQEAVAASGPAFELETSSAEMRQALELARQAADGSGAILIRGEPGTGKRSLARAIHAWGPRADRPFAIAGSRAPTPAHLEAEWFGVAKKMPGGAVTDAPGRVAFCDGGTLLVEDVDQLPPSTQPKLLRLIQDREYERHADFAPRRADVRIIATTSADLDTQVAEGSFSTDLLYALRGLSIDLPPLRRREADVLHLAERFMAFFARQTRRPVTGFEPGAADALRQHSWPGNVRELRNLVERSVLVARGKTVDTSDFPPGLLNRVNAVAIGDPVTLARVEELHIRGVLAASPSIEAAANTLGMDTVTFWRRRKQYGI